MKANLFKVECLTNLHVGSGEINYSIVDNEVEKDPVTGYPIIHASGIKGALREQFAAELGEKKLNEIFGMPGSDEEGKGGKGAGTYKFMDAYLITRPMRVAGSDRIASVPVVSVAAVNQYLALCNALGCNIHGIDRIDDIDFGNKKFLINFNEKISVEGEDTGVLSDSQKAALSFLKELIGEEFAVAAHMEEYDLPVLARNCLVEGKENLWYEELVPHGSVFWFVILTPDDEKEFALNFADKTVQFGAHASIGRGFCKVTCLKQA